MDKRGPKFTMGQLVMTSRVAGRVESEVPFSKFVFTCVGRHLRGDWGDLDKHDRKENEFGLKNGFRLLSSYTCKGGTKIWIITEWDRSVTTVLFPDEY